MIGLVHAGLLQGIAPAHVPGLLPAVLQRLPEAVPLPRVREALLQWGGLGSWGFRGLSGFCSSACSLMICTVRVTVHILRARC